MQSNHIVILAVALLSLLIAGCGQHSTQEYEKRVKEQLERQKIGNGYFGNIDAEVKRRVDVYRTADKKQKDELWDQAE